MSKMFMVELYYLANSIGDINSFYSNFLDFTDY